MLKFASILFLCTSVMASACPTAVTVNVSVNNFQVDDKTDADFQSLANSHFSQHLLLQNSNAGECLFTTDDAESLLALKVEEKLYLVISSNVHGQKIQLSGYTMKGKLFEIRTLINSGSIPNTAMTAGLFDASGPGREFLTQASLQIISN